MKNNCAKLLFFALLQVLIPWSNSAAVCESCIPAVNLSLPGKEQIRSFLKSQVYGPETIFDIIATEINVLKQVLTTDQAKNDKEELSITDLIQKNGFITEEHNVTTKDGYILTLQRVPGNGTVVFLMHGILASADDFMAAGPDDALVFFLASHGYDVWLGNARGNKYSRNHETISPECPNFWNFSFHEIGVYDLPAMIDFILNKTDQTKLVYIGHSQGNTAFFVMTSLLPQYNDKISLMIALSPIAFISHSKSPVFRVWALFNGFTYIFLRSIGIDEMMPFHLLIAKAATSISKNKFGKLFLYNFISTISGFDRGQLDTLKLSDVGRGLTGSSTKEIEHYLQEVESARFCQFDYGERMNKERYNSSSPPDYPLENVTAPVALFYSKSDWFSSHIDVMNLRDKLPNVVETYYAAHYNHNDYILAKNLKKKINTPILEMIKKYVQ